MTIRRMQKAQMQDTPERISVRIRINQITAQVVRESEERFPVLTPKNIQEAIDWQEARIAELMKEEV